MPLMDGKKFACAGARRAELSELTRAACIKGHRSSGCKHVDRPLFEIKKKGRPPTQCAKCRELRKSKGMHGRCKCDDRVEDIAPANRPKGPNSKGASRDCVRLS